MSQPPIPYTRIFDFEAFSANNPSTQQPGVQFEGEFDVIKITLDGLISRLAEIQRTDGKLLPSAFDETGIVESVTNHSYSAVIALLTPIVTQSESYKDISLQASSQAQGYANQCSAYLATALLHKNAAENSAILSANSANQAVLSLGATNVAAGTAQSAAYEAEQSKLATLVASNAAGSALGSVQMLQQQLANQYDNMLDGDQNLADVSNRGNAVTNLGLNAEDASDRNVYNRLKSMISMYVDPNAGSMVGYQDTLSVDSWLLGKFGLVFNNTTGLFQNATGYRGTYMGTGITGTTQPDSTIGSGNSPSSTLAHRKEILLKRLSMVASIFRTTFLTTDKQWGFNGDNRIVTLSDFQKGADNSLIKTHVWSMVQQNVTDNIEYRFQIFEAPQDGTQYARKDGYWEQISTIQGAKGDQGEPGIAGQKGDKGDKGDDGNTPFILRGAYNNGVTYAAGDAVTYMGSLYRMNISIGAGGYNPIAYSSHWAVLAAGGQDGAKGDKGDNGNPGATGAAGQSDKYKTNSTTSAAVNNNTYTITVGTGLSWTVGQNSVMAYDAQNHMHGTIESYNATTGVMVFNSNTHTGNGTYASWTINLDGPVSPSAGGIEDAPSDDWTYYRRNGAWVRGTYWPAYGTLLQENTNYSGMYDSAGNYYDVPRNVRYYANGVGGSYTIEDPLQYPNGYKTSWNTLQNGTISWDENTYSGSFNWGYMTTFEEYQNGSVVSGFNVEQDFYSAGYEFYSYMNGSETVRFIYDGAGQWHHTYTQPSDAYGTKYGTPVWQNPNTYETGGYMLIADGSGGSFWTNWDNQAPYPANGADWGSSSFNDYTHWEVTNGWGQVVAQGDYNYNYGGCSVTANGEGGTNTSCGGWTSNNGDFIASGSFYDESNGYYLSYSVTYNGSGGTNISIYGW